MDIVMEGGDVFSHFYKYLSNIIFKGGSKESDAQSMSSSSFLCTATIVTSRHAITAASCIFNKINASDLTDDIEGLGLSVVAGEHNLFEPDPGQRR